MVHCHTKTSSQENQPHVPRQNNVDVAGKIKSNVEKQLSGKSSKKMLQNPLPLQHFRVHLHILGQVLLYQSTLPPLGHLHILGCISPSWPPHKTKLSQLMHKMIADFLLFFHSKVGQSNRKIYIACPKR